jgi:uncharacterized membrane protein
MMDTGRSEAFNDGVLAIIITIMVLELKVRHGAALNDLWPVLPVFLSYVLSFIYLGTQSSSHVACYLPSERFNSVGQSALAVLAITGPICDRLDGGE